MGSKLDFGNSTQHTSNILGSLLVNYYRKLTSVKCEWVTNISHIKLTRTNTIIVFQHQVYKY